ncbi:hypothetical protein R3W88_029603 [Solanum pinnatisectum]|uniref:Uncharacterized protein n=1 Tax=Solanum pinnatisectum TaxID=50273 RepID=A0AAV9K684_9SOLN|nr:hypothetical protein R3W88_029603 [Solanum pinnatisectum]
MGEGETRQFYINITGSPLSISSLVRGKHINLTLAIIAQILEVPNTSAVDIVRKFLNDPTVEEYSRVDKGAMSPLHRLLFDVLHKIILPRQKKRTEANYLDLTLMELLLSKGILLTCHRYGFWLGKIFEYLNILVKVWEEQTTKDVLGTVNHAVIPAPRRAQLTMKDEEIAALKVSHNAVIDQLHVSYGLEHAKLEEEITKLKEDLAKSNVALETEKSTNSANLKSLYDLLKSTPLTISPFATSSQIP